MTEIITCPTCMRQLQVPDSMIGQSATCPECRHDFVVAPASASIRATPLPPSPPPEPDAEEKNRRRRDDDRFDDRVDDDRFDDESFDDADLGRLRRSNIPHRGGMILALGLLALVVFPYVTFVCGPMAWVMGNSDLAEIRAGRMDPSGEGMVQAGRILGIVSTLLFAAIVLVVCGFVGIMVFAAHH